MRPFVCRDCGGAAFHWVRNGSNHGRPTRHRLCDACRPPRGPSNRGRELCVRDGTSKWITRQGKKLCVECVRRYSETLRWKDPAKHRAAVRRYEVRHGLVEPRDGEIDAWAENHAALQRALGRDK